MWLEYLEELIRAARPLTLDSFVDILERFELGEQDYICELLRDDTRLTLV